MKNISSHPHFTETLLTWFDHYGRHNLPWQQPRSPYRVWVSEIMLQQTQVKTVIPYFNRFIQRFRDVANLALAHEDEVLSHWSGLGYYSRARNLHKTAMIIHTKFQGEFPSDLPSLIKLPGIGPSTAAAIASLAFEQPTAILDGNVKRVLSRYFLIAGLPKDAAVHNQLWQLANECMSQDRCANYTQAIMDFGATFCTTKHPSCTTCPLQSTCLAFKEDAVANYPNKSPKKIRPTKEQQFLLLYCDRTKLIYLEKRPPSGLWAGLWCLPSIDMDQCAKSYVSETYYQETVSIKELMRLKHSFTHFHLNIKAMYLQTTPSNDAIAELPGRWISPREVSSFGLAKPMTSIINHFITHSAVF